jgi:Putative beta-barrel porin-2, OmpL-like. bbp2
MEKLVFRLGLGFMVALTSLPCIALAQPTEPAPVAPPTVSAQVEPLPEPAPSASAPTMAPITPEPAVIGPATPVEPPPEEEAPAAPPTITGYVEAAYHISFTNPKQEAVPLHGFYDPTGNTFMLHAAHIAVNHSFNENVSATIEIDAGYDAAANNSLDLWWGGESTIPFDIQEAYATYKGGIFSVTAGKFVTYEGIEVVEGPLNPTITRGFLFGFAEPVTHTGVKFHFTGETVDFGIGLVNGWDKLIDNNNFKTFIFKLGLKPSDAFMANLSGTFGAEKGETADGHRLSLDLTGAWTASESFALWFQANYGMDNIGADDVAGEEVDTVSWFGFGLQPTYTSGAFSFGARVEYFSDPDNERMALFDGGATYINVTATPGIILAQGFKARLELRADIATEEVLGKPGDEGKVQITGAIGAEYVF